jgi:mandelate racemase
MSDVGAVRLYAGKKTMQLTPHIRRLRPLPVNVPLTVPLLTGGGAVPYVPLVLLDMETDQDITGTSYIFCPSAFVQKPIMQILEGLNEPLCGQHVAPLALEEKLRGLFRLMGLPGVITLAMSLIDMAAWDVLAKAAGVPLVRFLGGSVRPIPAYNSCGLGLIGPDRAAEEAQRLLESGFSALKVRLGYPELEMDVATVHAIRKAVGPGILLMSDYNQNLTIPEAIRRGRRLDEENLVWIEEPTFASDYKGHAKIACEVQTPIQLGENWWGIPEMTKSLDESASDVVMPDLMRIGGVSGWLRAAALAESRGLPMSSHLFPEYSTHLLSITPTRHWLEYMDWANPLLQEPFEVHSGTLAPPDRPGVGITWDQKALKRFVAA